MHDSQNVETPQASTGGWADERDAACTTTGILESWRQEILSHAAAPMDLEDLELSEMSQSRKDKRHLIPLTWDF